MLPGALSLRASYPSDQIREGTAPLRYITLFSLKVYLMPFILYLYPMSSGVPPRGCGIAPRVEVTKEGRGIDDEALELFISSISHSNDDELDGAIAVVLRGLGRLEYIFGAIKSSRAC
jgi:hypothetical protein